MPSTCSCAFCPEGNPFFTMEQPCWRIPWIAACEGESSWGTSKCACLDNISTTECEAFGGQCLPEQGCNRYFGLCFCGIDGQCMGRLPRDICEGAGGTCLNNHPRLPSPSHPCYPDEWRPDPPNLDICIFHNQWGNCYCDSYEGFGDPSHPPCYGNFSSYTECWESCPQPEDDVDVQQCLENVRQNTNDSLEACEDIKNPLALNIGKCECIRRNQRAGCVLERLCYLEFDAQNGPFGGCCSNWGEQRYQECLNGVIDCNDGPASERATSAPEVIAMSDGPVIINGGGGKPVVLNIIHCCPCLECLDDCMREVECGRSCQNGHCDPPNTDGGTDCGPYQIDPANYFQDICDSLGPCHQDGIQRCCDICDDPSYGDILCNCNCETNYNSAACGGHASEDACCAEKDRKSRALIECYRLRWTRSGVGSPNNPCPGSGGTPPYETCYTCEDLGRMHQGGRCGHINPTPWNDEHWRRLKACMDKKCPDCDTGDGVIIQRKERSMSPPRKTGGKTRIKRKMSPPTKKRDRIEKDQGFWEGFGKKN